MTHPESEYAELLARLRESLRECVNSCVEENRDAAANRIMAIFNEQSASIRDLTAKLEAERKAQEEAERDRDLLGTVVGTGYLPNKGMIKDEMTWKRAVRAAKQHEAESHLAAVFAELKDIEEHGTRFDLNPTVSWHGGDEATITNSLGQAYLDYIKRIDTSVQERAAAIRALVPEETVAPQAGITRDSEIVSPVSSTGAAATLGEHVALTQKKDNNA